jgi:hypothetical protein
MRVVVTLEEIKKIVFDYLSVAAGLRVKPNSAEVRSHTEGQYEDACEFVDGISYELEM